MNKLCQVCCLSLLLLLSGSVFAQGLILPLPGTTEPQRPSGQRPTQKEKPGTQSGTLIPLPTRIGPGSDRRPPAGQKDEKIILPVTPAETRPTTRPAQQSSEYFPTIPDEIVIHSTDFPDDLLPPPDLQPVEDEAGGLPIFPKDTSSAIFMIMKTWHAESYCGNTLLSHAVEVYGQEAVDPFQILGLVDDPGFLVNIYEEDITLDELLDILASITSRDWGVDIPGRTIYFYPKGTDTSGQSFW